jgi:hypothetical protein
MGEQAMRRLVCCLISGAVLVAGCVEQPAPSDPSQQVTRLKSSLKMPPPPPLPEKSAEPPYPPGGGMQLKSDPSGSPATVGDTTRVKAEVGVGAKGRRLDDPRLNQTIVTPARTLFRTQERIVFEISVPHALQLYEATNGRKPKTHEEFMEQVIQANQIRLPELPAGQRYVYDPQTGELMVEKPAG